MDEYKKTMFPQASRAAAHMNAAILTAIGNQQLLREGKSVFYECRLLASGAHTREAYTSENIRAAHAGLDGWESMTRSTQS